MLREFGQFMLEQNRDFRTRQCSFDHNRLKVELIHALGRFGSGPSGIHSGILGRKPIAARRDPNARKLATGC